MINSKSIVLALFLVMDSMSTDAPSPCYKTTANQEKEESTSCCGDEGAHPSASEKSALSLRPTDHAENTSPEPTPPHDAVTLLPHRAMYTISLKQVRNGADVSNVKGWMSVQMLSTGDGWASEQKSSLIVYDAAGEGEQILTTTLSWESLDGSVYNFFSRTLQNTEENLIQGRAVRSTDGNGYTVTYDQPEPITFSLPNTTIFPTNHLIKALERAVAASKGVFSSVVFDGGSESREAVAVNTVIGPVQRQNLIFEGVAAAPSSVAHTPHEEGVRAWPMNLAIFPLKGGELEPEYQIAQVVNEQGIITQMTLDFGAFTVVADLKKVDRLT